MAASSSGAPPYVVLGQTVGRVDQSSTKAIFEDSMIGILAFHKELKKLTADQTEEYIEKRNRPVISYVSSEKLLDSINSVHSLSDLSKLWDEMGEGVQSAFDTPRLKKQGTIRRTQAGDIDISKLGNVSHHNLQWMITLRRLQKCLARLTGGRGYADYDMMSYAVNADDELMKLRTLFPRTNESQTRSHSEFHFAGIIDWIDKIGSDLFVIRPPNLRSV